jgi:hypothetical protein
MELAAVFLDGLHLPLLCADGWFQGHGIAPDAIPVMRKLTPFVRATTPTNLLVADNQTC